MVFWLQRLKYPLLLWIADMLLYRLLGGAEIECGRCPVPPMTDWQHFLPPMTDWQHFLPAMGTVSAWVAVIWAYLMIESEKNGRY
ncbi:TPA: hypothetical protein ACTC3U_001014 [Neisseria meningitidis]